MVHVIVQTWSFGTVAALARADMAAAREMLRELRAAKPFGGGLSLARRALPRLARMVLHARRNPDQFRRGDAKTA